MNYQAMKALAEADNGFYSVIQEFKGATYEIFNYRLCSYTDFFNDEYSPEDTLNMRGTMFRIDTPEPELVCLPLMKFWNHHELQETPNYSQAQAVTNKLDGSLINTWIDFDGWLQVKTKASLFSDQAMAASRIIQSDQKLYDVLYQITARGYTINMEYCAPDNRIVLYYPEPQLHGLALRSRANGNTLLVNSASFDGLLPVAERHDHLLEKQDFVEYVHAMTGIEGYVVHFSDFMVKLKCRDYVTKHHAKDNVYNLRNLAEIIFAEEVDDLIQLFEDDKDTLEHIRYYEKHFVDKFNHIYNLVDKFWKENKHLPRKDYAIKGQQDLDKPLFGYAMSLYLGKPIEEAIKKDIVRNQSVFKEE